MRKSILAAAVLSLGFIAWQSTKMSSPGGLSFVEMQEATLLIEYTPALDRATLVAKTETDAGLISIEVLDNQGRAILCLLGDSRGSSFSDFKVDTAEVSASQLFRTFPEGPYVFRGLTAYGERAFSVADLSHDLLAEPVVRFPFAGAAAVPTDLTIEWASDPQATGYHIGIEQDENDGLTAKLPAGSDSFKVPEGVLQRGVDTKLEVVAIGSNGNCTLAEISFRTR